MASGAYLNDEMLSNVAKHNVTRFPFEIARLAADPKIPARSRRRGDD
jgi:4-hydroxybutyryl-CoA dehydratase/vinylacetyl-CoA-Delta-isomerase